MRYTIGTTSKAAGCDLAAVKSIVIAGGEARDGKRGPRAGAVLRAALCATTALAMPVVVLQVAALPGVMLPAAADGISDHAWGADATGSSAAGNGRAVDLTIDNSIPASAGGVYVPSCVTVCVYVNASGGNSVSGKAGDGGSVDIKNQAVLGSGDATAVYKQWYYTYNHMMQLVPVAQSGEISGIVALSSGGTQSNYNTGNKDALPGKGGSINITNDGEISVNASRAGQLTTSPAATQVVTIWQQHPEESTKIYWGGGILAFSGGGMGPAYNTDNKKISAKAAFAAGTEETFSSPTTAISPPGRGCRRPAVRATG